MSIKRALMSTKSGHDFVVYRLCAGFYQVEPRVQPAGRLLPIRIDVERMTRQDGADYPFWVARDSYGRDHSDPQDTLENAMSAAIRMVRDAVAKQPT